MNLTIRKANSSDFPAILLLINEFALFQKTPERVTITLQQMEQHETLFNCIIAENDEKELLGFASFFFAYYSWTGKALYLDDLYVREHFRKQHIGFRLLHTLIDLAKTEACTKVKWQVSKWNENAISFYKNLGAMVDETEINCDLYLG